MACFLPLMVGEELVTTLQEYCHCSVWGLYVVNNCSCEQVWEITAPLGEYFFSIPFEKGGKDKDRKKDGSV